MLSNDFYRFKGSLKRYFNWNVYIMAADMPYVSVNEADVKTLSVVTSSLMQRPSNHSMSV